MMTEDDALAKVAKIVRLLSVKVRKHEGDGQKDPRFAYLILECPQSLDGKSMRGELLISLTAPEDEIHTHTMICLGQMLNEYVAELNKHLESVPA